ncbi:MAG: Gfo/Idh/MocA family oxidoreductase [Candidatus Methylomirabilota bacterium]
MNLHRRLAERAAQGKPVRVGLIGAGKFGSMFLSQARATPGLAILGIADLDPARARAACQRAGWPAEQYAAASFSEALQTGKSCITDDAQALIAADGLEVVVEATGHPPAGIRHALAAIERRCHVVMVTVEADVLVGPLLARKAQQAGVVYSQAYGDQPALICELVDWARTAGFAVICAGKGTRYHPTFHVSTPDTVWEHFGWDAATVAKSGANPKMYNSFIDGTKSGIEMAAVCNAMGLTPPADGLTFPPVSAPDLATVLKPKADGGILASSGTVEVVSSIHRDKTPVPNHLQMGVYVVFEAPSDYSARCLRDYWLLSDETGKYAGLYRPCHYIGMELGISVASAALRGEPTGAPAAWRADVAAVAKRDLAAGEILDGEGGYMVWGRLMPAGLAKAQAALPLGLASFPLARPVAQGAIVTWNDLVCDPADPIIRLRREMERLFPPAP